MTENEIKNTKKWFEDFIETYALSNQETIEFKKAVACLEEIQQYRAIGTVEGYEKAIQATTEYYLLMKEYKSKVQDFEAIGTIEEFKALKEKSVPKKVVIEHIPKTSWTKEVSRYLCPSCRSIFSFGGKPYCSNCGQKLDWE